MSGERKSLRFMDELNLHCWLGLRDSKDFSSEMLSRISTRGSVCISAKPSKMTNLAGKNTIPFGRISLPSRACPFWQIVTGSIDSSKTSNQRREIQFSSAFLNPLLLHTYPFDILPRSRARQKGKRKRAMIEFTSERAVATGNEVCKDICRAWWRVSPPRRGLRFPRRKNRDRRRRRRRQRPQPKQQRQPGSSWNAGKEENVKQRG